MAEPSEILNWLLETWTARLADSLEGMTGERPTVAWRAAGAAMPACAPLPADQTRDRDVRTRDAVQYPSAPGRPVPRAERPSEFERGTSP